MYRQLSAKQTTESVTVQIKILVFFLIRMLVKTIFFKLLAFVLNGIAVRTQHASSAAVRINELP